MHQKTTVFGQSERLWSIRMPLASKGMKPYRSNETTCDGVNSSFPSPEMLSRSAERESFAKGHEALPPPIRDPPLNEISVSKKALLVIITSNRLKILSEKMPSHVSIYLAGPKLQRPSASGRLWAFVKAQCTAYVALSVK